MANSVDPYQTAPKKEQSVLGPRCLLQSILNSSAVLGNYLQQTNSADDIFKCIFFSWRFRVNTPKYIVNQDSGISHGMAHIHVAWII